MPATIVVGGQYGSEGKGKVVALISRSRPISCVVRCGGPNSGHTTNVKSKETILRQLPASVGVSTSTVAIGAGAVIDEQVLLAEVADVGIPKFRLIIDPRATLISEEDKQRELSLIQTIGSTGSGNGQALARRLLRENTRLTADSNRIKRIARVEPVAPVLHELIHKGEEIIVEGTQGFGLSLLHGPSYPYVTSKDTTASYFAAEVGISPRDVDQIVMVIRTFPIRVGGESGPLPREITWERVRSFSGAPQIEPEFTSVTKKLRRVADFDLELVRNAAHYNRPTSLAVMGLDRLDYRNRGILSLTDLTPIAGDFLQMLKCELGVPIEWVGTGFNTFDAISTSAKLSDQEIKVHVR